jgi:predicted permease
MNDFRYAWRGLQRSPALTMASIVSLGLGIGASMAIFSVSNAVILRLLPVHQPSELVLLRYVSQKGNIFDTFGYDEYLTFRAVPGVLAGLAAVYPADMNLSSDEATERVSGQLVSGNYFQVLGVQPQAGRLIGPDDDRSAGGSAVCVIASGLWHRRFGSAPDVAGRQIRINGRAYSILGVTPESFGGTQQGDDVQVYVPLMMAAEISSRPVDAKLQPPFLKWDGWLQFIGRLKTGISRAQAEAALDARFAQLPVAHRQFTFELSGRHGAPGPRSRLLVADGSQGFSDLRLEYERPLRILLFLAGLLLSIACANVANLLLVRATGRRKEIAIRIALGGGPWALVRQLMAESLLLAAGGAACGVLLSVWMADLLLQLAEATPGNQIDARPDWVVLAFLLSITCATAVLFGLAPAAATLKARVADALKNQGAGSGRRRGYLGGLLVVGQVALSVTLLAGAGLLLRSLHNLQSIQPGFQAENGAGNVILASLNPDANRYTEAQSRTLFTNLIERAEAIPGVKAVSAALVSPLSGNLWLYTVKVPSYSPALHEAPQAYFNAVGPGYFASIGSALVRGREFTRADRAGAPPVALVNESMGKKFWPGRNPVGERFTIGGDRPVEVVGVVRDSIYRELREPKQAVVYVPLLQGDFRSATLDLRVAGDPSRVFNELRTLAHQIDGNVPLFDLRTLQAQIAGTLSPERMLAVISTLFSIMAMLLAAMGLYGVLAYAVAQRSREIGIRMALGAAQNQVIGAVIRDALRMVAAGLALGIPLSLAATRWIASFLYGLRPGDPLTYCAVIALLCAASLAAALVPSRRAARVDPMVALRCD